MIIAGALTEHLEDADAPKPRFQIVDFDELPEPVQCMANDDVVVEASLSQHAFNSSTH